MAIVDKTTSSPELRRFIAAALTLWWAAVCAPSHAQTSPRTDGQPQSSARVQRVYAQITACKHLQRSEGLASAERCLVQLSRKAIGGPDRDRLRASVLVGLGGVHREQKKYGEALRDFTRVLALRKKVYGPDHPKVAAALGYLGVVHQRQGKLDQAAALLSRAVETNLAARFPHTIYSVRTLSDFYAEQNQHRRAAQLQARVRDRLVEFKGPDDPDVAELATRLAIFHERVGRLDLAAGERREALRILVKHHQWDHNKVVAAIAGLGLALTMGGREVEAAALLSSILEKLGDRPQHPVFIDLLTNLGRAYMVQGRFTESLPLMARASSLTEKRRGPAHPELATALGHLGLAMEALGQHTEAAAAFERALKINIDRHGPGHPSVAQILSRLGTVHLRTGRLKEAEAHLSDALRINTEVYGPDHLRTAQSLERLGVLCAYQGRYATALSHLRRVHALRVSALGPQSSSVAWVLNRMADVHLALDEEEEAWDAKSRALAIEERRLVEDRSEGLDQAGSERLMASTDQVLAFHLHAAADDARGARSAFEAVLRRKGCSLDAATGEPGRDAALSPTQRRQADELLGLRQQLRVTESRGGPTAQRSSEARGGLELDLDKVRARVEALEAALGQVRGEPPPDAVSMERVRQAMPPESTLVEYVVYSPLSYRPSLEGKQPWRRWGPPRYAAYVFEASGRLSWADLGPRHAVDAQIAAFNHAIVRCAQGAPAARPGCAGPQWNLEEVRRLGHALERLVWAPVQKLIAAAGPVFVAPAGELSALAFDALSDEDGKFLVETAALRHLTSGRDLLRLGTLASSSGASLVVEPAKITSSEAVAISSIPGARRLRGSAAAERAVKAGPPPALLHITAQSYLTGGEAPSEPWAHLLGSEPQTPLRPRTDALSRAGLVLAASDNAGGGKDDAILTALELSTSKLRGTQLALVSSGPSEPRGTQTGQHLYALRRAMVVAGAQSQALSLWSGAGEVTASFYTELAKGRGRAAALRDAKLSMIEGRGGHPYRWAALVLSGDWRPIEGGHLEPGPKLPAQSLGAPALARGCACRQASDPGGGTGWLCLVLLTLGARLRSER